MRGRDLGDHRRIHRIEDLFGKRRREGKLVDRVVEGLHIRRVGSADKRELLSGRRQETLSQNEFHQCHRYVAAVFMAMLSRLICAGVPSGLT